MLRHRLCKFGHIMFFALCVLVTGSFMQSCTDELDEYKYDDEYPEWLGASIYDFLKDGNHNGRTYNYLISIIDTLGYDEILARTGSKTLFVADDDAFRRFFQKNEWGVTCFEDLSLTQMNILLKGSMLDNTYLLDMMSCLPAEGNNDPVEGTCLRRDISLEAVDSVPYFTEDMLPLFNKNWDKFRSSNEENEKPGLLLAVDASDPMMVHFLREYVKAQGMTELDINILFNAPRGTKRSGDEAFIYQNQVIASGIDYGDYSDDTLTITCKNGYVYRVQDVLLPPSTMPEELRKHPNTRLFSHVLDRFSVPMLAEGLTDLYNTLHENVDNTEKVYEKRYVNYSSIRPLHYLDENGDAVTSGGDEDSMLPFDPGWAQYREDGNTKVGADMAAMLVPSDETMYNFFANGTGKFLIEQFAPNETFSSDDYMSIIPALDSIPQHVIAAFVRVLMLPSFVRSLPSKFDLVYDMESQEPLDIQPEHVEECVVANNGVIYILNNVFGPDKYRSVSAPPLILDNMLVMQEAINQLGYNAYLLAMGATYSFFIPDNDYFVYYDPTTIESSVPVAYKFSAERVGTDRIDIMAVPYSYDPATYELKDKLKITQGSAVKEFLDEGGAYTITDATGSVKRNINFTWAQASQNTPSQFLRNRLTDLLDYLIVVGNVEDGNKYYRSKGYGTIKCDINFGLMADGEPAPEAFTFYGGEQLENGKAVKVMQRFPEDNGITYCTMPDINPAVDDTLQSGIIAPPTQSLYSRLKASADNNGEFKNFYNLCVGPQDQSLLSFFEDIYPHIFLDSLDRDTVRNYSIFYGSTSKTEGRNVPRDQAVPFFTSYHYTVYAPNNAAIEKAYAMGLPTWEELQNELGVHDNEDAEDDSNVDEEGNTIIKFAPKYKKVASYIRLINKFLRYHFQDNSVFVDNHMSSANYETAAINEETGRFFQLNLEPDGNTYKVVDHIGNFAHIVTTGEENKNYNIMTRDLLLYCGGSSLSELGEAIETSSFAALHEIDNIFLNNDILGFDGQFCRYADDGELIDTMKVEGFQGPAVDGTFLVAKCNNKELLTDVEGVTVTKPLAYIMRATGSNDKLNKEEYVLDERGNKILIDNQGYWCARFYDEETKTYSYQYVAGYDDEGNYQPSALPATLMNQYLK